MDWKKALIWVVVFTLTIAFFEVVFLYDFGTPKDQVLSKPVRHPVWFLIIVYSLTLLPCFILGYGKLNPITGFIPPFLLNLLYWYISALMMKRTVAHTNLFYLPQFNTLAVGTSFVAGFFGIILVFVTRKLIESIEEAKLADNKGENKVKQEGDINNTVNSKNEEHLEKVPGNQEDSPQKTKNEEQSEKTKKSQADSTDNIES